MKCHVVSIYFEESLKISFWNVNNLPKGFQSKCYSTHFNSQNQSYIKELFLRLSNSDHY